ncbi:MAG: 50S ribosomal protein L29 [Pseudanabaenaceae cyanobacterium]
MALPKISEARELSDEALREAILNTKRELFTLRMKVATRQPVKPHEFKHAKHRLAQLMTVERERMRQAAAANAAE